MNRAAKLITGESLLEKITPTPIELHKVPIKATIMYIQDLIVFQALKFGKPLYMRDTKKFHVDTTITLRHDVNVNRTKEPRLVKELSIEVIRSFTIICHRRLKWKKI